MLPPPPAAPSAATWLGTWSRPPDRPAQVALGLAAFLIAVVVTPGGPRWLGSLVEFASLVELGRRRRFLVVAAFASAFLSLGYIAFYLRGGPRAAEAAAYWLQGRAMAHGELRWIVPEPSASFRVRDLLFSAPDHVSGIFPPGYPLLLAPAFLVGAPMLVGPLVAAALVGSTWLLAREMAAAAGESDRRAEMAARIAVALSLLSAAARYHTADSLPYGAAAVAVATALGCALRARRTGEARFFGVAGLAIGFLAATQPASAVASGAVVAALATAAGARGRALSWMFAAALPGLALLLAANHAAVGRALASPMAVYFGTFEPHASLGVRAAAVTSLHRLRAHLVDIDNLEPLALLALVPVVRRARGAALIALVIAGQLVLAAPWDPGSVAPGSGARLLLAVVPIEHALMALALVRLFPTSTAAPGSLARATMVTFALSLAGFAVHASYDHERVAAGDLGRPRFEPDLAREASVTHGLLFFDDDQGFELAYDPGLLASHGIQAVRMRGDDHDRLLYDSLGHPSVHRYAATTSSASVTPWTPPGGNSDTWRFEGESDWPPVAAWGGHPEVLESSNPCVSDGKVLALTPSGSDDATVTLALPVPRGPTPAERKTWTVVPRVMQRGGTGSGTLTLSDSLDGPPLASWTWEDAAKTPTCIDLPSHPVELGGDRTRAWLVLRAHGASVTLDKTTLRSR